ncbi:hypothetical protein TNCV_471521 [Trichonephila clavipes]|nr:hypothetical protein TNCV_471521 [Trichonephila clavipes]
MLGRRIASRQPPLTCLRELRRALLDEWCNIPQDQIDNLILGMPRLLESAAENYTAGTRFQIPDLDLFHDEFRGPRSDTVRQMIFLEFNTNAVEVVVVFPSWVRVLMPLKYCSVKGFTHVKFSQARLVA